MMTSLPRAGRRVRDAFCGPLALAVASLVLVGAGCSTPPANDSARLGPFFTPTNRTGVPQLPFTLRRVVLLPLAGGETAREESTRELDAVMAAELQRQNRFEVVPLSRDECQRLFRVRELPTTAALPADFVAVLRRNYAADGVVMMDVTAFKAYRPLTFGVRAKLAAFEGQVRLVWSFDNVFSAADQAVANSARRHYLESDRRGIPADFTQGVLQSPSRFAGYVAAEMFASLPPVYTPPQPERK